MRFTEMVRPNKKIEELQHHCWVALNNAERVEDIRFALDEAGFDQARRDELWQLLELSKKRVKIYNVAYNRQTELTGQRDDQHDALDQLFILHRRQFRRTLEKDTPPYRKLGLGTKRSRRLATWFQQSRTFYSLLLKDGDYKVLVDRYRLKPDFLTQTLTQIDELERLQGEQQLAIGKARQSTKDRDATVDELEKVYLDMKDIACHALKDQPHYLAAMGFVSTEPAPVSV
jgi:hypothetical protein